MSNITGDEGSFSSGNTGEEVVHQEEQQQQQLQNNFHGSSFVPSGATNSNGSSTSQQPVPKKKRNLPGTPDPNAEVIALSPTTLMATNRFVCEICNKGFQRDQNLQLHRRGHNLPWKLKQRATTEVRKRVYICPEPTCVHHNPARALGDLTGIKKHFSRKHGEKKWKCDKCSKKYAVQSDWKAHQKTCGTREYKCDCGTIFSRRDSFITHRAFCDALAEENNKVNQGLLVSSSGSTNSIQINQTPITTAAGTTTTTPNTSIATKLSLPHEELQALPMPFKPMNMNMNMTTTTGGLLFSSSSSSLFGGPTRGTSSSSNLQLMSSNTSVSAGFNNYMPPAGKNGCQLAGSAHMSATALLQKAAQMGATASNSTINSPLMQKSFVSSMPICHQPTPALNHDHFHTHPRDHSSCMVGINGGGLIAKNQQQEIPQLFDPNINNAAAIASSVVSDMGMFSQMFMGGDENQGLLKNMQERDQDCSSNNSGLMQARNNAAEIRSPAWPSRFGGGDDMMTVDFLGIGGSRSGNLQEQQHQLRHQKLDLEAMRQQRLPIISPFQQQLSNGESGMEKTIWDV